MQDKESTKIATKALSDLAIKNMKPGDPIKADNGLNSGLRVKCGTGGTKTFFYRYRHPVTNRQTQVKIGNYPDVSLSEARVELQAWKQIRRSGVCPKAHLQQEKAKQRTQHQILTKQQEENEFTVERLITKYLTEYIEDSSIVVNGKKRFKAGARKTKGQLEVRRTLTKDVVKPLGHMPASQVTKSHVLDIVNDIRLNRGARVQAGNVLRELKAAYDYALGSGYLDESVANPALLASLSLKLAKVDLTANKGKRFFTDNEIKTVLSWLPTSGFSATQKNILRFMFLTACRPGEVCKMEWKNVDLTKNNFIIPETKNYTARYVPLSKQAVQFLKSLPVTNDKYVFPGLTTGRPITTKSLIESKWSMRNPNHPRVRNYRSEQLWLSSIQNWSPHDIRRTVRTGVARLGCRSEIGEAMLGHSKKGIEGTYDLHKYFDDVAHWLQIWADHLDKLMGLK